MVQALENWIPDQLFELENPLTPEEFCEVIENNLTHHFRKT
ncbi:hypothetical protein [Sphingorhabdus sp.]|jgi:hypothetical protein